MNIKSYLFCFAFILNIFIPSTSYAKKIIIRNEGSADGIHYDRVRETHRNPFIGEDSHRLICLGSGNTECNWQHSPWIVGNTNHYSYDEFIAIFEQKIKDYFASNAFNIYYERFITDGIEVIVEATKDENNILNYTITINDKE